MYSSLGHLIMSPRIKYSIVQYKLAHTGRVIKPEALYESLRLVHDEVSLEDVERWMHSWSWIEEADLENHPPRWCTRLQQIYGASQNSSKVNPTPNERESSTSGRSHVKRKRSSSKQRKEDGVLKKLGKDGFGRLPNPSENLNVEDDAVDPHGARQPPPRRSSRPLSSPTMRFRYLSMNAPRSEVSVNFTRDREIPSSSTGLRSAGALVPYRRGSTSSHGGRMQDLVNPPQIQENRYQNQNRQPFMNNNNGQSAPMDLALPPQNFGFQPPNQFQNGQQNMRNNIINHSHPGSNYNHSIGQLSRSHGCVSPRPHQAQQCMALVPYRPHTYNDPYFSSQLRMPHISAVDSGSSNSFQDLSAIVQRINQNLNVLDAARDETIGTPAPRGEGARIPVPIAELPGALIPRREATGNSVPSAEQAKDALIANMTQLLRTLTADLEENENPANSTNAARTSRSRVSGNSALLESYANRCYDLSMEDDETYQLHKRELPRHYVMLDLVHDLRFLIGRSDRTRHTLYGLDPIFRSLIRSITKMVYPRGIVGEQRSEALDRFGAVKVKLEEEDSDEDEESDEPEIDEV